MIDVCTDGPGRAKVTFRVSERVEAGRIAIVGEFNGWDRRATSMHLADGQWSASVVLTVGRQYRFRYLIDGERWENDWEADDYADNEFGGSDSVVDLSTGGPRRQQLGHVDPHSFA